MAAWVWGKKMASPHNELASVHRSTCWSYSIQKKLKILFQLFDKKKKTADNKEMTVFFVILSFFVYKTKTANAQMVHICHTYRILHSSPLHNQPSQASELLHTILKQNACSSSSFPVILLPWVNIKVIQTGIKLYLMCLASYQVLNKSVHKCHDTW